MNDHTEEMRRIFDLKYQNRSWPGGLLDGTRSGHGSTMEATQNIRRFLPQFVADHAISSIFDAPCGDFHWMKEVTFNTPLRYFGGDIAPSLIAELDRSYGNEVRRFFTFDIVSDPFFDVDLWICRDCLFHLPLDLGLRALRNAAKASIRYVMLTSHYVVEENTNIAIGRFRKLDMTKPPFSLPEPLARCNEYTDNPIQRRFVGVWRGSDLATRFT